MQAPTQCSGFAVESAERKDFKPRVTILQLIRVPSVCVLLIASLFAAASLTFLDPLLGEQPNSCASTAPVIPHTISHPASGIMTGTLPSCYSSRHRWRPCSVDTNS